MLNKNLSYQKIRNSIKIGFTCSFTALSNPLLRVTKRRQIDFINKSRRIPRRKTKMDMEDNDYPHYSYRKPRKLTKVRSSPFEAAEAIHRNRKYWDGVFHEINTSVCDKLEESKKLSQVLPSDLYEKVCETLDIPKISHDSEETMEIESSMPRRSIKEPMLSFRKTLHIDRELDSDTDVEFCPSDEEEEYNVHKELLSKPVREQVTWPTRYLQPEREDEKSLVKKADDLTDRIAKEFCEYMKELGGDQQSQLFTPKAIKELFQIEFDTHVARSLRVVTKELPSIEEKVANVTGNPEKSLYEALEREVTKDIKAEEKPDLIRGFSGCLQRQDQWRAPRNDTRKLWRSAKHVPQDLVTLKTVWEGITNLRSVKEYCRWMIDHPEHRKPPYLNSMGMFNPAVLDARLSFEASQHPVALVTANEEPAPIDHIRRRLSQLAESS